jgi:hypothetical protein
VNMESQSHSWCHNNIINDAHSTRALVMSVLGRTTRVCNRMVSAPSRHGRARNGCIEVGRHTPPDTGVITIRVVTWLYGPEGTRYGNFSSPDAGRNVWFPVAAT